MARSSFGGTYSDWLFTSVPLGSRSALALKTGATTLTFWSTWTGSGNPSGPYTDLLNAGGQAVSSITVEGHQIPRFQGPDGIVGMWAWDGTGTDLFWMEARDSSAVAAAVADAEAAAATAVAAAAGITGKADASELLENVMNHGAVADGDSGTPTDNTTAFSEAAATGKVVFIPDGTYAGNFDLDPIGGPRFVGAGFGTTKIKPNAGHYFIDGNRLWPETYIEGIDFVGGAGAIRNRYTSSNVTWIHQVLNCRFRDYTVCAISHNSSDMPLWKVRRSVFKAISDTATIGVALPGLTDLVTIADCEFQRNKVHVKLGNGGNNAKVDHNDFVQYTAAVGGNLRANIWVVPRGSSTNAGPGFHEFDNKHGNENLGTDDRRLLYADEGSGTYFGDRLPNVGADSTGFIVGHNSSGSLFGGGGVPIVYSTTPNIRGSSYSGKLVGGTPSYGIQYRTPTADPSPENISNVFGPFQDNDNNFTPFPVSNQAAVGFVDDPQGVVYTQDQPMQFPGGGRAAGYVKLVANRINSYTLEGASTKSAVTDSRGRQDATELILPSGLYHSFTPTLSLPIFIDFELLEGSTDPATQIYVQVGLSSASNGNHYRRRYTPGSTWRPHRIRIQSASSASQLLKFRLAAGATGTRVKIGRVHVYHAYEPIPYDLALPFAETETTVGAAGGAAAQPTPVEYAIVNVGGNLRKIALHNV